MLHFITVRNLQAQLARFANAHPCLAFLFVTVGAPLTILLTVTLVTTVIMLPIAFVMGWL